MITIFAACSSDDNDSPHQSTPTSFRLYEADLLNPGYKTTTSLTGSDTVGNKYSGTYAIETLAAITLEDQTVTPVVCTLSLSKTTHDGIPLGTSSPKDTTYLIDADTPFRKIFGTEIYTPQTISQPPAAAEIGSGGTLTSWIGGANGYEISGSWLLEDAGSGFANLVENATIKKADGAVDTHQETISTIDAAGKLHSIAINIEYPNENPVFTIVLAGQAQ